MEKSKGEIANAVLLLAWETPASALDEKSRRLIWNKLWISRYKYFRYNNPKHLCSERAASFAKIVAAARTLGIQARVKRDGIYFEDGSKIGIMHPVLEEWAGR